MWVTPTRAQAKESVMVKGTRSRVESVLVAAILVFGAPTEALDEPNTSRPAGSTAPALERGRIVREPFSKGERAEEIDRAEVRSALDAAARAATGCHSRPV